MANPTSLAVIILAAGKGTRMKSALPKVLHKIAGLPMLGHVIKAAEGLNAAKIIIVAAPDQVDAFKPVAGRHTIVVQDQQLGTGHAVRCAEDALKDFSGDVLVLYGDVPLMNNFALQGFLKFKQDKKLSLALIGFEPRDPTGFGRFIIEDNNVLGIVEEKDLNDSQRNIKLCNSGVICADAQKLWAWLGAIKNNNSQREYYLTDIVALACAENTPRAVYKMCDIACLGVNDRLALSQAEYHYQTTKRVEFVLAGVTLTDPATVQFAHDTQIAPDVIIHPHVVFGPGVTIDSGAEILSFSHLEGCVIKSGARIGPFARIRPGTLVEHNARVGNFVELKNTQLGAGAKVNHLSYVGDTTVGANANLGAGTITCNYDGFTKSKTTIGAGAFIGSNSALIAPVTIGDNAMVAAGSVIAKDVPQGALGVARAVQKNLEKWADNFRNKQKGNK